MAKTLAIVAVFAVIITLTSAIIASWMHDPAKEDLLKLVQLLFSWQLIAGGLAVGGAKTFEAEIKSKLAKVYPPPRADERPPRSAPRGRQTNREATEH